MPEQERQLFTMQANEDGGTSYSKILAAAIVRVPREHIKVASR